MTAAVGKLLVLAFALVNSAHGEEAVDNSNITFVKLNSNGYFYPRPNLTFSISSNVDQRMIGQCGGIFRNLQNLIESPKFISPRPICNLRCEYQVASPYICENEFHVQFLDFAIDSTPDCENDRVIINHSEVICGSRAGAQKFRTEGGVLNITFSSKSWDLKDGKGFRLLVTRLPCVEKSKEDQTEADSLEPDESSTDRCYTVGSSYNISEPGYGQGHPIYGVPANFNRTNRVNGRQDIPVIPLPPPIYPPVGPINPPILPPQFLPQCCRNVYNQQRFLMLSQGFPAHIVRQNDCIFVIRRNSPSACRLKIVFKYFLLDDPQAGQFGCVNNFIEIDGQRICGCKTNFVYETLWGYEPKVIRLRTAPGTFASAQGFVFDVIQEPCPFKIQDEDDRDMNQAQRQPRHLLAKKLLLKPLLLGSNDPSSSFSLLPSIQKFRSDFDEKFKAKFHQPEASYIDNVCVLNHLRLFQLKLETIGMAKQYCIHF